MASLLVPAVSLPEESSASHKVTANEVGEPFMQRKFQNMEMGGGS